MMPRTCGVYLCIFMQRKLKRKLGIMQTCFSGQILQSRHPGVTMIHKVPALNGTFLQWKSFHPLRFGYRQVSLYLYEVCLSLTGLRIQNVVGRCTECG